MYKLKPSPLNETQASEFMNIAKKTLQAWRFQRRGPRYMKLGRAVRYRLEDLVEFMDSSVIKVDHEIAG